MKDSNPLFPLISFDIARQPSVAVAIFYVIYKKRIEINKIASIFSELV